MKSSAGPTAPNLNMTMTESTEEKPRQSFKCANCGAKMEYKPGSNAQECPYCGHANPIPSSEEDITELDFRAHLAQTSETEPTEDH